MLSARGEGKELSTAQHSRITRGWHWLSRWFGERGWYWFAGYLFAVGSIGNNGIQIESPWYAAGSVLVVFYIGYAFGRVSSSNKMRKREKKENG